MCGDMRALVSACLVAGCGYQPGSFHSSIQHFRGQHATVECLDFAVDRRNDLPDGDVVVAYAFGNRCDHPAIVDLGAAVVTGRKSGDREVALPAYDPHHELAALSLDGRAVGAETIAYAVDTSLREVCVDAASIARATPAAWLCFPSPTEVP
jgi:hypothetical protein